MRWKNKRHHHLPVSTGLNVPIEFLKSSGQLHLNILCPGDTVVHDTKDRGGAQYHVGQCRGGLLFCFVGTVEMKGCIHFDGFLVACVVAQRTQKRNGLQLNANLAKHVAGAKPFVGDFWYLYF